MMLEGVPCNPPPPCHVAFPIWCLSMADGVTTWWAKKEAKEEAKKEAKERRRQGCAADADADEEGLGDAVADGSADTKSEL